MELLCRIQKYHWGRKGQNSLVAKLASANSGNVVKEDETYAEFWMGTHPNGPSLVKSSNFTLQQHLSLHPDELGSKVVNVFGKKLPFLFKILSINEPLSIQAHPDKTHAEELFNRFPNLYKDDNHKPELAIALSKFEALCGFRPQSEIKKFLRNIPEMRQLIESNKVNSFLEDDTGNSNFLKDCFQSLMLCEKDVISSATEKLIERLNKLSPSEHEEYLFSVVKRIYSSFPEDIGIFCVYWFNYLILSPGEALYLAANEPHAYLHGDCLECMANSDNVVRAGLTPKFRDVETLCSMLTYKTYKPSDITFKSIKEDEYCQLYSPPVQDFAVAKIVLPKKCCYTLRKRESASILLVLEGQGDLNSISLNFGKVLYIPRMSTFDIRSDGIVLFQAFCNV